MSFIIKYHYCQLICHSFFVNINNNYNDILFQKNKIFGTSANLLYYVCDIA